MKRSFTILGLLATAAVGSYAQSVTLFGLVDVALERVSNIGPGGASLMRVPSLTGALPSRWGMRGTEDLGGGLRAVFTLEQGFAPDEGTPNQGGRAFGRQSFVGLAGDWGSFTVGRQYSMLFWSILDADVMGPALYGSGSLDSYIPNARADNALAYRGTFGGLTLGATYSFGRDAVNAGPSPAGTNCRGEGVPDQSACREWSALLKYDTASWGAALAVDEIRGGPGAFAGLTSSAMKDTRTSLNGYVKLAGAQLTAGLIRRDNDADVATQRSDLYYLGAAYPLTPLLMLEGELLRLDFKNSSNQASLATLRATYSLSRRTALYATYGHIANQGALALSVSAGAGGSNPAAGASQSAVAAGIRHSF